MWQQWWWWRWRHFAFIFYGKYWIICTHKAKTYKKTWNNKIERTHTRIIIFEWRKIEREREKKNGSFYIMNITLKILHVHSINNSDQAVSYMFTMCGKKKTKFAPPSFHFYVLLCAVMLGKCLVPFFKINTQQQNKNKNKNKNKGSNQT